MNKRPPSQPLADTWWTELARGLQPRTDYHDIPSSPAEFAVYASKGRWKFARHLVMLNDKLLALARGEIKRLVVLMPPRHGKSEFTSKYFPAWFLGINPDKHVILTSYEATFAASWGRKTRDLLVDYGDLFGVRIRDDVSSARDWSITGHDGGMITAGAGGPITGRGGDLLVIDDPVKNEEEARSTLMKDKIWDWWHSTAYTRLEPGGVVVLMMTRWAVDDLAGRMLADMNDGGEPWEVLCLPALAETNDPLGRFDGEALWPERFDETQLRKIRRTVGEQVWLSLYQQRPAAEEGGMFKANYFLRDDGTFWPYPKSTPVEAWQSWDTALKTRTTNDRTAGSLAILCSDGYVYLLPLFYDRAETPDLEKEIALSWAHWKRGVPVLRAVRIEDGAGTSIIQHLRRLTVSQRTSATPPDPDWSAAEWNAVRSVSPIVVNPFQTTIDKVSRANKIVPFVKGRNVRLVDHNGLGARWLECLKVFPNSNEDDAVDSTTEVLAPFVSEIGDGEPVVTDDLLSMARAA